MIKLNGLKLAQAALKKTARQIRAAERSALNKTAIQTKKLASKAIRAEVSLPLAYINSNKKKKGKESKLLISKSTAKNRKAIVYAKQRGTLLSRFKNRQLKKKGKNAGISVKVKNQWKKMRGAFFAKLKNGEIVIAIQEKPVSYSIKTRNIRIKVLHGPSVSQVYKNVRHNKISPEAKQLLATNLSKKLIQLLNK